MTEKSELVALMEKARDAPIDGPTSQSCSSSSPSPSPPSSPTTIEKRGNIKSAKLFQINLSDVTDNCMRAVMQDMEKRKLVTELHPVGVPGVIVVQVAGDDCQPYTLDEVFVKSKMTFVHADDFFGGKAPLEKQLIDKYVEDLKEGHFNDYQDVLSKIYGNHELHGPVSNAMVFYYIPSSKVVGHIVAQFGFYGRYHPDSLYIAHGTNSTGSEDDICLSEFTKKAENDFKNEGRIFESNFAADDEKCSYSRCPHLQSWEARAYALKLKRSQLKMENVTHINEEGLDSLIKELPSLSICSRCRLARYCSRECQVSDYKNHKSLCKSAGLRKL